MSGLTPGPWTAQEWSCHAPTTVKAGDLVVAECSGHGRNAEESIADAQLIAAAPNLLEAAKIARSVLGNLTQDSYYDNAKAAIQKAIEKAES